MSVRPLCVAPHPVLRRPARLVEVFGDDIQRMARDMIETMYANDGIGLAAPQIGQDLQLFIANPSQERGREVVVVNPVLESAEGRAAVVEGCLSVPDVWERVRRASRVRLRGQDPAGEPLAIEAEGLMAIVLQHEMDHLQGQLFIDRISWWRRCRLTGRFYFRHRIQKRK
ncbi:MAG: peptide deformylase [Candidatus Omnitrophica bacterium]|nr:peptide deformylase [Candidatus Omnitrophota bacterium]